MESKTFRLVVLAVMATLLFSGAFVAAQEEPGCACTTDGFSGPIDTGIIGCDDHLRSQGDSRFFCYIGEPRTCPDAEFSQRFPGATYKFCDPPPPPASLLEYIESNPDLSILSAAVNSIGGIASALNASDATATLFAPTNNAFIKAADALGVQPDELLSSIPQDVLQSILLFHVNLDQEVGTPELLEAAGGSGKASVSFPTASDASFNKIRIVLEELNRVSAYLNYVTQTDLDYDMFLRVIIENQVFSRRNNLGAFVQRADIQTENGVVHIIDSVLKPPDDIATIASRVPRLSTFVQALQAADLVDEFTCDGSECPLKPVTVFAPNNAAFATLLEELDITADELFNSTELLTNVLLYHVSNPDEVTSPVLLQEIVAGAEIPNLFGGELVGGFKSLSESIQTEYGGNIVLSTKSVPIIAGAVNNATIVQGANIGAFNGVIHIIDNVLIPPSVEESEDITLLDEPLSLNETTAEESLFDAINDREDLSILSAALALESAASLRLALEEVTPDVSYTILAPNDDAFLALAEELGVSPEEVLAAPFLIETLLYHVGQGAVTSDKFSSEPAFLDTVLGLPVQAQVVDGDVVLNDATKVVDADIVTLNGVIHVIDSVLTPDIVLDTPAGEPGDDSGDY